MTTRKPVRLSFPDWVDLQVRTAEDDGAFDNLPGKGKPIPGLGAQQHEMAWIVDKLRRENVDMLAALPPALALAKEVELLPSRVTTLHTDRAVREHVADLNTRIRAAMRAPQVGPPVRVRPVDVDELLEHWRAAHPARKPAPVAAVATATRRWWRRR